MVVSYISYPRFISRYKLTMMQQIGSNGTNGHMKPRRDIANLRLHWIAKPYFSLRVHQLHRNAKCPCSLACTSSLSQKSLVLSNAQKHNRRTQHYQSAYSACNRLHITIESKTGSDDVAFSWQKRIIICSCGHTLQAQGTVFTITLFVHCRYLKECPQGYRRWRPITYNGKKETETAEIKTMAPTHINNMFPMAFCRLTLLATSMTVSASWTNSRYNGGKSQKTN